MSDGYTYTGLNMNPGNDTTPPAPVGEGQGVGTLPSIPTPEVVPPAPCGDADHVGVMTGFPDSSGETMPKAPVVDGAMPLNKGRTTGAL